MLRLPRNLYIEGHRALCRPRNLHFEVHQVLRLPRNLHSALRGSPSAPATNLHFEVHQMLCLPRNLYFEVHQVLRLPRNLYFEVHQALHLPRNLHFEVHQMLCLPRNLYFEVHLSAVPATKSANEPHVQKSRFTAPVTKSGLLDDHHHVQSAVPATKTAFSKQNSSKTRGFHGDLMPQCGQPRARRPDIAKYPRHASCQ